MSSDQRPGKVRVFSSRAGAAPQAPTPARRRGDPQQAASSSVAPVQAEVARADRSILLAIPFLLGCAIGGGVIAWFGVMPGAGQ